jgi:DnaJ like chaperone protein
MNKKKSYGKWIGGGLGWAFGGPIGGILGFVFGSMYDGMQRIKFAQNPYQNGGSQGHPYANTQTQKGDFSASLLVLAAAVMKADGRILKSELEFVRSFFVKQFGTENANENIKLLREILKQDINVIDVSMQIRHYMEYSSRLQLIHFLFGISMADGQLHPKEVNIIEQITRYLDVDRSDFLSIKAMFVEKTNSSYQILDVSPKATDDEVKKAYRTMAIKFHPDKVAHLGNDIKNAAEEKLQKLNAAYDKIKKERRIK